MALHRARPPARRIAGAVALAAAGLIAVLVPGPADAAPATPAAPGSGGSAEVAGSATPAAAVAEVATPTVTGPIAGAPTTVSPPLDYAARGYVQEEFFLQGTAQAYLDDGPWGADGRWNARPNPDARAPYATRVLVRRPTDPGAFNGTVLVEWMNVSAGFDVEPDFVWTREELLRKGYAYVGVSAQAVGVNALRGSNAARYGSLSHPGDAFSYDMFSQVSQALAAPAAGGPRPLGDLTDEVSRLLADGESQSAGRLVTYVNSIQPLVEAYDGFLIHSANGGAPLSQPSAAGAPQTPTIPASGAPRPPSFLRTDLDQPVLHVNTETDVRAGGFHEQPDSPTVRIWELTGTAHVDSMLVGGLDCGGAPVNDAHQTYGLRAAVRHLDRWAEDGEAAPIGPRLALTASGAIDRDPATGLARGGIRLPDVAVPTRTLAGSRPPGSGPGNPFCGLAGSSDPWNGDVDTWDGQAGLDPSPTPEPILSVLYGTRAAYEYRVTLWSIFSALQGFVLPEDVTPIVEAAQAAELPGLPAT
jgi:hypothetical protein